jgi:hypothetical protein
VLSYFPGAVSVCNIIKDTFLLLDALEQDMDELRALKPLICLEMG